MPGANQKYVFGGAPPSMPRVPSMFAGRTSSSPSLAASYAAADELIAESRSEATRDAYRGDWSRFSTWCTKHGLDPRSAQPDHVAAYAADLVEAGRRPSTIARALSSISVAHKAAGRTDNAAGSEPVRLTLAGARRRLGVATRQARPLSVVEVARIAAASPDTLAGGRDRALLLLGFAAALRRSELALLAVADIAEVPQGLQIKIRRSKTDQEGASAVVPVAYARDPECCPVRAWQRWLVASQITDGPAWRSIDRHGRLGPSLTDRAVSQILDRAARRAGIDTAELSAHSLRAGYVTTAALGGAPERAIAAVSRHKSIPTLRGYVRRATVWQDAATDLGW